MATQPLGLAGMAYKSWQNGPAKPLRRRFSKQISAPAVILFPPTW